VITQNEIDKLICTLVARLAPVKVWLFGSYAREDYQEWSDVDILVIVPESNLPQYKRMQQARLAVLDVKIPKDILVMTVAEWERDAQCVSSLVSTILHEGVCVHG
jgi:uncharacterized protein